MIESFKNWINEVKDFREEAKQQNFVDGHQIVLRMGYPYVTRDIYGCITVGNEYLLFDNKKYHYDDIVSVSIKKLLYHKKYKRMLVLLYKNEYMVFSGKHVKDDYRLIYDRFRKYKKRI